MVPKHDNKLDQLSKNILEGETKKSSELPTEVASSENWISFLLLNMICNLKSLFNFNNCACMFVL